MFRPQLSKPTVGSAANDLASAIGDLTTSVARWVALQPAAQQAPVYVERVRRASADTVDGASAWAGETATRVRDRSADVASATRTGVINLALVAVLLWWVDRLLTGDE